MATTPSTTVDSGHPEDSANLLSKLMVYWINPLITKSGQSQLSSDDVWETPSGQSVAHDAKTVWDAWLKEDALAASENREPSLTQALFNGFGRDFHLAGGLQAVFMFSQIAQPYLVGELVNFIQIGNGGLSYGAGISVALLVVSLISSMSFTAGFSILRRLGVSIRSGVMMAVYEKSLRLTSASRMQNTIGQTTNLMSIDAEKLFFSAQFLHFVWHGPIANIIVMCLIIQDVGVGPGLLGLASQLALLPIQNLLADTIGRVRRRMVSHTDERVKLMNEILQAIRIIKVYAWEVPMEKRVVEVRTKELHCLNLYLVLNSVLRELLFVAGPIASITVFSSLIFYFGQTITLAEMFRVTAFINILRLPSSLFGQALKNLSDGKVSAARLTRFFQLPTLPQTSREIAAKNPQIAIRNANFKWDVVTKGGQKERYERTFFQVILAKLSCKSRTTEEISSIEPVELSVGKVAMEDEDTLKGINITSNFPGELIALIGSVGAGKSSLISALLNEIPLVKGTVTVDGRVAYCPQTPWIQNLTLRDNILFGEDYADPDIALAYEKVIDAAALKPDIAILTDGDLTEIGERGINLSGGQKARVSIARAILAARTAQIILLDDPFSAVDGATGNWIFEHGILGLLKDRLRVVALNSHRHLLHRFDRVIVLDHGRVVVDGRPSDLSPEVLSGVVGADVLPSAQKGGIEAEDDNLDNRDPVSLDVVDETIDLIPPSHQQKTTAHATIARKFSLSDEKSTETASRKGSIAEDPPFDKEKERKLILAEIRKVGDVSSDVYNKYFAAAFEVTSSGSAVFNGTGVDNIVSQSVSSLQIFRSVLSISCQVALFAGAQFVRVAVDYSLARWAQYGGRSSGSKLNDDWSHAYYISFGVLFIFLIARSTALNSLALLSATHIHRDLFRTVVCAPVTTFFDTHTMGEVLNRFSKDTEVIDSSVPEFLMQAFVNWMQVISVFALSLYATPYFAIVIVPLVFLFHRIYLKFGSAQRDLKRLEAVSRSPVYASLSETLSGLDTIRAYSATDRSV
jgi:ATP-binding cassette, subfamily C (CFTR/MRP), member 1